MGENRALKLRQNCLFRVTKLSLSSGLYNIFIPFNGHKRLGMTWLYVVRNNIIFFDKGLKPVFYHIFARIYYIIFGELYILYQKHEKVNFPNPITNDLLANL